MQELLDSVRSLTSKERKALAALLKRQGVNLYGVTPIFKRESEEQPRLSYAQQRQWFLWQLEPDSAAYHIPAALRLTGRLDLEALRRSFTTLVERHETLRTTFAEVDGQATQVIHPQMPLDLELEHLDGSDEQTLRARIEEEIRRPFDLCQGPLLRIRLLRLAEDEHVLVLVLHHIVSDGWSTPIMVDELIQLYAAYSEGREARLPALPIQYADYALWQRAWMEAGERERQLSYWQAQLEGEQPVLELPVDHPRPAVQSYAGASLEIQLGSELAESLKQLAQRQGVTLFMLLLASFQALLHRYSGQDDIRVGVPIANRTRVETEGLIGFFVNTQVLKAEFAPALTFEGLLQRIKRTALDAQAHQDLPFEQLVEALQPERSLSHSPLFQVLYNHQREVVGEARQLPGLQVEPLQWQGHTTQFDLMLSSFESQDGLSASLTYATDLFYPATIERLAGHWRNLLEAVCAQPELTVAELCLLDDWEHRQIVEDWNCTRAEFPLEMSVSALIEEQVRGNPDAVALVFGERNLTYAELNRRANRLAHYLRGVGVGPDVLVGIAMERSLELVVGLLAILKAGGAYVPLDPDYPQERLAYMLEDSGVRLLLTQQALQGRLPVPTEVQVLCLDAGEEWLEGYGEGDPQLETHPANLAYVIYTSGSTGRPKGAGNSQQALVNRLWWMQRVYQLQAGDCVLQKTPFSFDVSVWEFFWPLLTGARLAIAEPGVHRDPDLLIETIHRHGVTTLHFVPSMLQVFIANAHVQRCNSIRRIVCSGEALPAELAREVLGRLPTVDLFNLYGPTEAAIDVTHWTCTGVEGNSVPIGRPIDNLKMHILEGNLQPAVPGCNGELYLGGIGLARGYHARPALTAERFVPDPFDTRGGRLYRTGDLARYREDGVIDYMGRLDHQVKIRGLRIELGEIEASLRGLEAVREAVVLDQDGPAGKQLVGYVVPVEVRTVEVPEAQSRLREALKLSLKSSLPEFMVPSHLLFLERLPVTPNGKLDRKALPLPDASQLQQAYVAPRSELERQLAAIWADVLKLERVGLTDNFFELGGDSIISLQVVSRARQLGLQITPKELFRHQTVQSLAVVSRRNPQTIVEQGPVFGESPLVPIQQWFFEQDVPQRQHWNQALSLMPIEHLDARHLLKALETVVRHHDALCLRFTAGRERWKAEYQAPDSISDVLWVRELAGIAELERATDETQRSLDLQHGPLLRALLASLPDGSQRLLLVIHHLVVDGVSWRVLLEDLQTAYSQLRAGQPLKLPAKTSSFQAWAERLQARAGSGALQGELNYWQAQLRGMSDQLPCDHPQGGNLLKHMVSANTHLDRDWTRRLLNEAPAAYRTQINDLLLTALARVICRWTGQDELLVRLEGHGREDMFEDIDLTRTVGWFTVMYPVRLSPQPGLAASIKTIKEQLRAVPDRGLGYGLLRYLGNDDARRVLAGLPQGSIVFNYLGQFDGAMDKQGGLFQPAPQGSGSGQDESAPLSSLLSIDGQVYGGELNLSWTFSQELFEHRSVQELADAYAEELKALVEHCCDARNRGVTPADFPLAGLTQEQLDSLPVVAPEIADIYPLSPMQQGMLFHSLYEQDGGDYINQMRVDVDGLDTERFCQAWQGVLDAHDILRTSFVWQGDLERTVQVVHKQVELPFSVYDWRDRIDIQKSLDVLAEDERRQAFDLAQVPLLRLVLVRTGENRHHLIYTSHHILMDGWSNSRLIGEVLRRYDGRLVDQESGRYRDYIEWLQDQDPESSETFWKEQLAELDEPTRLVQVLLGKDEKESGYGNHYQTLERNATEHLKVFAQQNKVTVNTLVQAAWTLLLQRYTGQSSVCFGATVAGRPAELPGVEEQLGLFINTLPVIGSPRPEQSVAQWIEQVQERNLALREFEHTPLYEIQRWVGQGGEALFDSLLVFENYPVSEALEQGAPSGLRFGEVGNREQTNYPMTLAVGLGDTLSFHYIFDQRHFPAASVERLAEHFLNLLSSLVSSGQTVLGKLLMLGDAEERFILRQWDQRDASFASDRFVHELVADRAAETPDAVAVIFGEQQLTYGQLDAQANRLAHRLIELGVGPEVRVAIAMRRSAEIMVAFLAVLKAGGGYVPLDIAYPEDRLLYMMQDCAAALVLTQSDLLERLPIPAGVSTLAVDRVEEWAGCPDRAPEVGLAGGNLAYVIYTSGSTGQPKGVAVSHGPLVSHIRATGERYETSSSDCELHFMSFAFDGAHEGWMHPLINGARVLIRDDSLWLPEETYAQMHRYGVTIGVFPPVYLQQLAEHAERDGNPPPVRVYCFGGDAVPQASYDLAWRALRPQYLFNGYGPTETVVTPLLWKAGEDDACGAAYAPIGTLLGKRCGYVLDADLNLLPVGLAGELYLGGEGVARGYLGRPGLTAERFVPDPFGNGERVYRSGDLTRARPNGLVDYLGRVDHQVKVRGFRIELGEIEARLLEQDSVREAVVLAQEGGSGKQLVGYVVTMEALAETEQAELREALKQALRSSLPEYMVPAHLLFLKCLPVTPNGKLDRKALPLPDASLLQQAYVAPRSEVERQLAEIWADVLKLERVGLTDNFFELGGDSIISLQVVGRARQAGLHITPKDLFQQQTVQALAAVARREEGLRIAQGPVNGDLVLTPIQRWFFEQSIPERHHWNQSVLLKSPGGVWQPELLEQALQGLVKHHDVLRLRFSERLEGWRAEHGDSGVGSGLLWREKLAGSEELLAWGEKAQRSLDLQHGPLLRALLADLPDGSQCLLLVIHHLVVDGVSWRILLEDLRTAYDQLSAGQALKLPAKTSSFQAWAERLHMYASGSTLHRELDYWKEQLGGFSATLPCDNPEGACLSRFAASANTHLDSDWTRRLLQEAPTAYRTQINDLLLTALARVVCRWSGQGSALIQLEGHGREELFEDIDLSRTVGWFTSVYPLRLAPDESLESSIKIIKEQLRAVPHKGIGFGILRYLGDANVRQAIRDLPQPRITFNYLGQFDGALPADGGAYAFSGEYAGAGSSEEAPLGNWLTLNGQIYAGELNLSWSFSSDMFERERVQDLADAYAEELKALIEHCCQPEHRGVTPSDFPLVVLTQKQLDTLPIVAEQIADIYPLSPMQQGMLFHSLYAQGGGDYINQLRVDIEGLDAERFREVWQTSLDSHDVLRSGFVWDGDLEQALQVVHKQVELPFSLYDWRGQPQLQGSLDALAEGERRRGFDLTRAPLLRLVLVRTAEDRYHLIYTNHHILMDGWSNSRLLGEVLQRYAGQLPEVPAGRYRDYIAWLQRQDSQASEMFWKEQLVELDEPTRLVQAPRGEEEGHGDHVMTLGRVATDRLRFFAQQCKVTVNTLVQAAWLLLLQRYSSQDVVCFGATVAGRPAELVGIEEQVGLFINTLPVIGSPRPEQTVAEWIGQVQALNLALREFEHTPLYEIQRWAGLGGEALFDSLLVFENYPVSEALEQSAPSGLNFSGVGNREQTNYPLTLLVGLGQELSLHYSYDLAAFDPQAVIRLAGHLQQLLERMTESSTRCLGELPILTENEYQLVVDDWNSVGSAYPDSVIPQLVEAQAASTPDSFAVLAGTCKLSYREVNERANRLAFRLIELGVGPEVRVAIALSRGADLVVGLLAVLKAGGAYVPLDPDYPQERLVYILEDSRAALLLTEQNLLPRLPSSQAVEVVLLQTQELVFYPCTNPPCRVVPDNLAYVIYTSGSTGRPKGVAIAHRNVQALVHWSRQAYSAQDLQGVLASTSICFDLSVWEIFVTLASGGYLVMARNALELPELPFKDQVRLINTVPSAIAALHKSGHIPPSVRTINLAGEPLKQELVDALYENPALEHVYDLYGPSEDTTYSTFTRRRAGGRASIGRPIENSRGYVLCSSLQPVQPGGVGELYLAGAGVTRGYLARPGLTAEKYVPDPFSRDGGRLYRTGDLTRHDETGNLEYLGRLDHQVKIHGYRIEMSEIEARLLKLPTVREAAVLAQEVGGEQRLVSYIVADGANEPEVLRKRIRTYLQNSLPGYMVPSYEVLLERLPLTPNGKLDRKALPAPEQSSPQGTQSMEPRTPLEARIARIWAEVLELDQVGVGDNFFELGGHSLDTLRLMRELKQALGLELPVSAVFKYPTVANLAGFIEGTETSRGENIIPLGGEGQPLFYFHPAGGTVYCYLPFVASLKDSYSAYGVMCEAYLDKNWNESSWAAMIVRYVENLRRVQPNGPYHLAGWSLGGAVAMDVASALEAVGEEVRFLGLFDPTPPAGILSEPVGQVEASVERGEQWPEVIAQLCLLFPGSTEVIHARLMQEAELSWDGIVHWVLANIDLPVEELEKTIGLYKAQFDTFFVGEVFKRLCDLFTQYRYQPLLVEPHLWWSRDYGPEVVERMLATLGRLVRTGRVASSTLIDAVHAEMVDDPQAIESFSRRVRSMTRDA
ncbi:non-ribosomal peptide synthetase [Pseudomonas lopnurensis]|uniref:non-ribosomal peptide synthetase n=1 Tax=Pseudomonas lopnurensis TaxID=1477517 RepID=UPI0028AD7493|nr:non-ribosomal peptide synthase/polyketide synthase [Pseudomonas lopnurensis]